MNHCNIAPEKQRRILYYMMLTQELEDRIERKLYRQGKIVGGVYVGRGQESIAIGSCILTQPEDVICPLHRDMGAFLIRGMTPKRILAQYMGRVDGYPRGRDGNMHMGDRSLNIIALVNLLADNLPVCAGIGLEVIDLRSLLPLDKETILESVKRNNKVIILHEDTRTGGIAGEITAIISEEAFEYLDAPVLRVTAPDTPVPFSPPLEEFFLPKVSDVLNMAWKLASY
jgi:hypothetical protein